MRARADRPCSPSFLRVYDGAEDGPPPPHSNHAAADSPAVLDATSGRASGEWRLSELYRWLLKSGLLRSSEATHTMLEHSVLLFERLCGAPPLKQIDRPILSTFIAELHKQPGLKPGTTMAANTVLKHYRAVASLLNMAVEEQAISGWRKPRTLPTADDPEPRIVPPADLEKIVAALHTAKLPQLPGVPAGEWWFALVSYLYYTGVRIGHARKLTWGHVHLEHGLVAATTDLQKTKKRKRVYLHGDLVDVLRDWQAKRAWADAVECPTPREAAALAAHRELVFPWFAGQPAKGRKVRGLTKVHLYRQWTAIQEAAGLEPDPVEGWYGFHDLRRTLGTEIADRHGDNVAANVLGHDVKVFRRHYDARRSQREADAVQSLPTMPGAPKRKGRGHDRTALLPGFAAD